MKPWLLSIFLLTAFVSPALASIVYPEQIGGVKTRIVDDKDPLGIRWRSFIIRPIAELSAQYDDNVFRTERAAKSDFLTDFRPGIAAQTNWQRHALYFSALGDFGRFKKFSSENYNDYSFTASGQYDIAPETYLTAGGSYIKQHQSRSTGADLVTADSERGSYKTASEVLGFTRSLSFLKLRVFARNSDTDISNDNAAVGSNDFINRKTRSLLTILSYDFQPGNGVFVSNTIDKSDYTLPTDFSGTTKGENWKAGFSFLSGGIWSGNVFAGYIHRTYSDGTGDSKKPYVGTTINWNPSLLTQIALTVDKQFTDTTSLSAAGIIRTTHRLEFKRALTSLITGRGVVGYDENDYVGANSAGRQADFLYTGIGADYSLNDRMAVRLGYDYRERMSNRPNDEYKDNRVLLSLVYNQ